MEVVDNIVLLGSKVLIQLEEAKSHTETDTGLVIPLFENDTSDGGRPITKISAKKYLSKGTIINMSPKAKDEYPELNIGDTVFVSAQVASPQYQFFLNRDQLVLDWTGVIIVNPIQIEAKINK